MFKTQIKRESEQVTRIFAAAFETAPVGALLLHGDRDQGAKILRANPAACEIFGRGKEELEGVWLTRSGLLISTDEEFAEALRLVARVLDGEGSRFTVERWMRVPDGDQRLLKMTVAPLAGEGLGHIDGQEVHAIMQLEDITVQRQTELELSYRAGHDILTDLMNRRRFTETLIQHLAHGRRYGSDGALLLIDLDSFKQINEDFGQGVGDEVLRRAAARMRGCLRGSDLIARMGGDEFAILLPSGGIGEAEKVADKLLGTFRGAEPRQAENAYTAERKIGLSIGIVALDGSWPDPDAAYSAAYSAMYAAKAAGGDGIAIRHGRRGPA